MGVGDRSMADVNRWHETPVQLHMSACIYEYDSVLIMKRKCDMVLLAVGYAGCDVMWCDVTSPHMTTGIKPTWDCSSITLPDGNMASQPPMYLFPNL